MGRQTAWTTMVCRTMWLLHTSIPDQDRSALSEDGLFRPCSRRYHQQATQEIGSRFNAVGLRKFAPHIPSVIRWWSISRVSPTWAAGLLGTSLDSVTMTGQLWLLQQDALLSVSGFAVLLLSVLRAAANLVVPLGLLFMHKLQRWIVSPEAGSHRRHKLTKVLTVLCSTCHRT